MFFMIVHFETQDDLVVQDVSVDEIADFIEEHEDASGFSVMRLDLV